MSEGDDMQTQLSRVVRERDQLKEMTEWNKIKMQEQDELISKFSRPIVNLAVPSSSHKMSGW
jgi:hypothetical protein